MSGKAVKTRSVPPERCLAVLLDGELVRLFRVDDGGVEELANSHPQEPREAAPAPGEGRPGAAEHHAGRRRHRDPDMPVLAGPACDHVHRTADRVAALARNERIDRILAGGAPDCVAELSRILRTRLGGDIEALRLPTGATAAQVAEAARVTRAEPSTHEEEVLGDLIDAVGRGLAALGLPAVLEAVNDHGVAVLVLAGARAAPGAHCPRCGSVFAAPVPAACPGCGRAPDLVPDVVALAADHVRERGGNVEVIAAPAAGALSAYDGIAALLRYAFPGPGRASPWEEVSAVAVSREPR